MPEFRHRNWSRSGRAGRPRSVSDPRFGVVNLYPESALREYFGDDDDETEVIDL